MKRAVSVMLCLVIIFTSNISAFAMEPKLANETTEIFDISSGKLFLSASEEKIVAILTDDSKHLIDISIKYFSEPNIVYQWTILDYVETEFCYDDRLFWSNIISCAESRSSSAEVIYFTETVYDEPTEVNGMRSSAGADLLPQLESLIGQSPYSNYSRYNTTLYGLEFGVKESMEFRILNNGTSTWSQAITVSSLIVGVLGLATSGTLVSAICGAFGIAASAASTLPANGKIKKYICRGMYYRDVTINDGDYIYNTTFKFVDYRGYENASNNNTERAYIDTGSRSTTYDVSGSYYLSYSSQIQDAYEVYQRIGWQG